MTSIEAILVILLVNLKMFLSIELSLEASRISSQNLENFPRKYLWCSSTVFKPSSLQFTVILLPILRLNYETLL